MSDNLTKNKTKYVVALGFFDSLHQGHQKLLDFACNYAKEGGKTVKVVTFDGNLKGYLTGNDDGCIWTKEEKENKLLNREGLEIFYLPVTKEFLGKSPIEFLDYLNQRLKIENYVCGEDYRFGKNAEGDANTLKKYANRHRQNVDVIPIVEDNGEKISTSKIKTFLATGNVEKANQLLNDYYSVSGIVYEDRQVGREMGFPTANIRVEEGKFPVKDGVYAGRTVIDGKIYKAMINFGTRPTFELNGKLCEAHILDYKGDLYGKTLRVWFIRRIRDVKKFENAKELRRQLKEDRKAVKKDDGKVGEISVEKLCLFENLRQRDALSSDTTDRDDSQK